MYRYPYILILRSLIEKKWKFESISIRLWVQLFYGRTLTCPKIKNRKIWMTGEVFYIFILAQMLHGINKTIIVLKFSPSLSFRNNFKIKSIWRYLIKKKNLIAKYYGCKILPFRLIDDWRYFLWFNLLIYMFFASQVFM